MKQPKLASFISSLPFLHFLSSFPSISVYVDLVIICPLSVSCSLNVLGSLVISQTKQTKKQNKAKQDKRNLALWNGKADPGVQDNL